MKHSLNNTEKTHLTLEEFKLQKMELTEMLHQVNGGLYVDLPGGCTDCKGLCEEVFCASS